MEFNHYSRKRLLILTLTLSTSALALATVSLSQPTVFAQEDTQLIQGQTNATSIKSLTSEEALKQFQSESQTLQTQVKQYFHVMRLGYDGNFRQAEKLSDPTILESLLQDYDVVSMNGHVISKRYGEPHVFIVNKGDVFVQNEAEYNNQMATLKFAGDRAKESLSPSNAGPRRIHALFQIQVDANKRYRLEAAGLATPENSVLNIDEGINIYSHGLDVDNKFYDAYRKYGGSDTQIPPRTNITEVSFKENDEESYKLIQLSGADQQHSVSDKVRNFVYYVANNVIYDWTAARKAVEWKSDINYYLDSDLFAITKQKKAMCVGFSTTAARAFTMMGIPAYVVSGTNHSGVAHATTRAYYDGKWHTIDSTGIRSRSSDGAMYTYNHFENIGKDSYKIVDKAEAESLPAGETGYMIIDRVYEDWAMKQTIADLMLVNKERALVSLEHVAYVPPKYVSPTSKEQLRKAFEALKQEVEGAKATSSAEGYDNVINQIQSSLNEFNAEQLTEEEFKDLQYSLELNHKYLSQLNSEAGEKFKTNLDYQQYVNNVENHLKDVPQASETEVGAEGPDLAVNSDAEGGELEVQAGSSQESDDMSNTDPGVSSPEKEAPVPATKPSNGSASSAMQKEKNPLAPRKQSGSEQSQKPAPKPQSIKLNKTAERLTVGGSVTLRATILPSNANPKSIQWTSSNPNVAQVVNGKVTAVAPGQVDITAKTAVGGKVTKARITVVQKTPSKSKAVAVYRLYNPSLKRHLYTQNMKEAAILKTRGWKFEGEKFKTATKGIPVYRLYHSVLKEHLYTTNKSENDLLAKRGWRSEGISWYSSGQNPVYIVCTIQV